jgi:Secretion system C-terminal sorting domain
MINMSIKNFILFLSLLFVQGLSANKPDNGIGPLASTYQDAICTLPPPSVLHVDKVGSGWVQLSWPAVAGASQYRIVIVEETSGDPVSVTFVPGNTTIAQVSTGGSNVACHAEIQSVCYDGTWDDHHSTPSDSFKTIILELVVTGYTFPSPSQVDCTIGVGEAAACTFYWSTTQTPFEVIYATPNRNYGRRFSVNMLESSSYQVQFNSDPLGNEGKCLTFHIEENQEGTKTMSIRFRSSPYMPPGEKIAELAVSHVVAANQPGKLFKTAEFNSSCTINKVKQAYGLAGSSRPEHYNNANERSTHIEKLDFMASPNPFHDFLTIQLPESNSQIGNSVYLYDLLGSVKQTHTATAGQNEITLNTAYLSPGVYFLRIESGGTIETIKVLKTE